MNIYVGNLAYGVDRDTLRSVFEEFGQVSRATVITDRETGQSKGFGFVEMANDADGQQAIESLNNQDLMGRNMKVNEARPREERPRRPRY